MDNNGNYTNHTRHISRIMPFVRNGEKFNFRHTVWCEGGLQLSEIVTTNVREDEFNPRLGYYMVILDNWHNTCQIGVTVYIRLWITMCSEWLDWVDLRTWLNEFEIFIWV